MQALLEAIQSDRLIALSGSGKREAMASLAGMLKDAPGAPGDADILDLALKRETQANTYMGHGIACPHARVKTAGALACAIGWAPQGIEYGGADRAVARLIIFYRIPDSAGNEYLREISMLARVLERNERLRDLGDLTGMDALRLRLLEWVGAGEETSHNGERESRAGQPPALSRLLLPEIEEMLDAGRFGDIRGFLAGQPAPEIAELIMAAGDKYRVLLFRLLPRALADGVFALLDHPEQNLLLGNMAHEEIRQIVSSLSPDDRTALFEELPANVTQRLLDMLNDRDRKQALTLLSYPENSVGRLMTNRYVSIRAEWTAAQAMEHIRRFGTDSETMVMVYITDERGALKDDLLLRKIILADPSEKISNLLDGHYAALRSLQDREDAVHAFKKYDLYALPVTDSNGIMLGIVTSDDILDVAEEEATEDFHKGMAIGPLDTSYIRAPLAMLYRRRISWLIILVFVNIFSGAGLAYFEELIASAVALVFFLPLLIDSGGNAGAQAATLVIRSMALGEVRVMDYLRVVRRELMVSLGLGLSMAAAVFVLAWWRADILIGMITSVSMSVIVVLSSVMGVTLPFILRRLGRDPAAASAPLLTSLADIFGVLIYFGIAAAWMKDLAN